MLKPLYQVLANIPATFWAVVAGSLFSLIGILTGISLTNRASDRRLRVQLESDRELKNREREMAFRKEIYGAAAEAIAVSMSALAKFSDLSVSLKEISSMYLDKSPALAKVNLVANEGTLRALTSFGTEFAGAFLRLTQQRMVLSVLQEQIGVKARLIGGFERTRDAMIELMRNHNIDGIQAQARFEAIQTNYEFEASRITTANLELQQMIADLSAKQIPFAKECFAETARVNRLIIPLLVAARMELDLSISEERYSEILCQSHSKHAGQFDEFIQKVSPANAVTPSA